MSSNPSVLITGVAGFIGSALASFFLNKGFYVRGIDNLSSGKESRLESLKKNAQFEWLQGDVTDFTFCSRVTQNQTYVLHHAAMVSVNHSLANPMGCHHQNVTGTLNILEAAKQSGVKRVIFPSSAAVYGNVSVIPIPETTALDPQSPYAISKVVGEYYCKLYTHQYMLQTMILRYFNVFGPDQDADSHYASVIPKFTKALKAGKSSTIFGDGEQLRDFVSIETVCNANFAACTAASSHCATPINIGSGVPISVNQLYRQLATEWSSTIQPIYLPAREGEVRDSCADITRAKKILFKE